MAAGAVRLTLLHLERHLTALAGAAGVAELRVRDRFARLGAAPDEAALLREAGIAYHAPGDATRTGLEAGRVALVFSNTVLEHVPPEVLEGLMRETRRILAPDGLAFHGVNCGDHYAYFDRTITPIHYLRFSERAWRWWNNDILYQNRLRPTDFVMAARRAGLRVVLDRRGKRKDLLEQFATLPVDEAFRSYPIEELCCTSMDLALAPAEGAMRVLAGEETARDYQPSPAGP
jgi:SAM-dependent methyltransferase